VAFLFTRIVLWTEKSHFSTLFIEKLTFRVYPEIRRLEFLVNLNTLTEVILTEPQK
jgi:hypothetical protein